MEENKNVMVMFAEQIKELNALAGASDNTDGALTEGKKDNHCGPVKCDMCGYMNKEDAELCYMCSNYLK